MSIGFRLAVKRRPCRGIPYRTRQSYADSRPRSRVLGREFARNPTKPHVDQNSASTSVREFTRIILFARRRFRADLNFRVSSVAVTANNRRARYGRGHHCRTGNTPGPHTSAVRVSVTNRTDVRESHRSEASAPFSGRNIPETIETRVSALGLGSLRAWEAVAEVVPLSDKNRINDNRIYSSFRSF